MGLSLEDLPQMGLGRHGSERRSHQREGEGRPQRVGHGAPCFVAHRLPHLPGDAGGTGGCEQLWPHHPSCAQDPRECHLPFHVSGLCSGGRKVSLMVQRSESSLGPGHADQETPGCQAAGGIGVTLLSGRVRTGLDLPVTCQMTLHRSWPLSGPQFPHLRVGVWVGAAEPPSCSFAAPFYLLPHGKMERLRPREGRNPHHTAQRHPSGG